MKNEVKAVPPRAYKKPTAKNLLVKLKSTKPGIPPRAVRVPASAITRLMAEKREQRKMEISTMRMQGKI